MLCSIMYGFYRLFRGGQCPYCPGPDLYDDCQKDPENIGLKRAKVLYCLAIVALTVGIFFQLYSSERHIAEVFCIIWWCLATSFFGCMILTIVCYLFMCGAIFAPFSIVMIAMLFFSGKCQWLYNRFCDKAFHALAMGFLRIGTMAAMAIIIYASIFLFLDFSRSSNVFKDKYNVCALPKKAMSMVKEHWNRPIEERKKMLDRYDKLVLDNSAAMKR